MLIVGIFLFCLGAGVSAGSFMARSITRTVAAGTVIASVGLYLILTTPVV